MRARASSSDSLNTRLTDESAASLWGFARATLGETAAAEIAVRAAFADAWPPLPPSDAGRARLLVALGRAEGFVRAEDARLPADAPTPFGRAFRSLAWPVQVLVWGRVIDALDDPTIADALGPEGAATGDPSRRLLRPYLVELARSAPLGCADALRRAAARVDAEPLRRLEDLDPHIGTCELCRSAFPLRAARSLCLLASPDTRMPPGLVHQIEVDHARAGAGLELARATERPAGRRPPSRRSALGVLALALGAIAFALYATIGRGPTGELTTGSARGAAGAPAPAAASSGGVPMTQAAATAVEPDQTTAVPQGPPSAPSAPPPAGGTRPSASGRRGPANPHAAARNPSAGPGSQPAAGVPPASPTSATTSAPMPPPPTPPTALSTPPSGPFVGPPPPPPVTAPPTTAPPTTAPPATTTTVPTTSTAPTTTAAPTTTTTPPTTTTPTTTGPTTTAAG